MLYQICAAVRMTASQPSVRDRFFTVREGDRPNAKAGSLDPPLRRHRQGRKRGGLFAWLRVTPVTHLVCCPHGRTTLRSTGRPCTGESERGEEHSRDCLRVQYMHDSQHRGTDKYEADDSSVDIKRHQLSTYALCGGVQLPNTSHLSAMRVVFSRGSFLFQARVNCVPVFQHHATKSKPTTNHWHK